MPDPGSTVYPSVSQLRAVGIWIQSAGLVTGLDYRDPTDQYDLRTGANLTFLATGSSLKTWECVNTDTAIPLRVPPINAATCYANPDWAGLDIAHRNNVGVYGPSAALSHGSWAGSGNVGGCTAAGVFSVVGTGKLSLYPPSEFPNRLSGVATGSAPVGLPTAYMQRRADCQYSWHNFPEGVYDWRDWERLNIPITCPVASDELTVKAHYTRYVFTDNHLSDSDRASLFSWVSTLHSAAYTLAVASGAQSGAVTLIEPHGGAYPKLEHVTELELRGFDNGSWTIGEPELVLVSGRTTHARMKTFEGYEYQHGGGSFHGDGSFEYYDADENNAGHANRTELTARYFDYVVGAGTGLDLTTGYTLDAWANIVNTIGDAFDCSVNATAFSQALIDSATPSNQLSPCYGFDVGHAWADSPVTPLEQNVDGGTGLCSIRAGTWAMAKGIRYKLMTDKIVDGRIHGRMLNGSTIVRNGGNGHIWRRIPGDAVWLPWQSNVTSDEHGHWDSKTCPERNAAGATWEYLIGPTFGPPDASCTAYTREYTATSMTTATQRYPDLCQHWMGAGQQYLAYRDRDGKIRTTRSHNGGITWIGGNPLLADTTDYCFPAIQKDQRGRLWCAVTKAGTPSTVKLLQSQDDGLTWATTVRSFAGRFPDLWLGPQGMRYLTVKNGSHIVHRGYADLSTVLNSAAIDGGSDVRGAVVKLQGQYLLAALPQTGGTVTLWASKDDGVSWASQPVTLTGDEVDLYPGREGTIMQPCALERHSGSTGVPEAALDADDLAERAHSGGDDPADHGQIDTGADSERPALLKQDTAGMYLMAAVTDDTQVEIHRSLTDGQSWGQIA